MMYIKIDGKVAKINLKHERAGWQYFNVISPARDDSWHPSSQHSVPKDFFALPAKIKTGGHTYEWAT